MPTQHKNTADGGRRIKCLRKHQSPPAVEQQSRWAASVWGHARAEHGGSKVPVDPDWQLSRVFNYRPRLLSLIGHKPVGHRSTQTSHRPRMLEPPQV